MVRVDYTDGKIIVDMDKYSLFLQRERFKKSDDLFNRICNELHKLEFSFSNDNTELSLHFSFKDEVLSLVVFLKDFAKSSTFDGCISWDFSQVKNKFFLNINNPFKKKVFDFVIVETINKVVNSKFPKN